MNRVLPSCVGLLFLVAACTAPSALSTRDTGHPASSVKSGAPPMLHFEGETIAHAAKAFNRYNRTKIVIDDPDIADRKVGGTFVRTDPESFVTALGLTMSIQATTVGAGDTRTIRLSGAGAGQ